MPRTKKESPKPSGKPKKVKLSPEQRSAIAKARWAKIKADKEAKGTITTEIQHLNSATEQTSDPSPAQELAPVPQEAGKDIGMAGETINQEPFRPAPSTPEPFIIATSAAPIPPQLAVVAHKKPKRYQGPKEFGTALKAAESRLAKAIYEQAETAGRLAALNAEIPMLIGVIAALKGTSAPQQPFNPSGSYPNAIAFQAPLPQVPQSPMDLQSILRAAQVAPPSFRSTGGAVHFTPDVVGTLEGPDDDDPDKFITGPHAGGGWVG